MASVDEYEIRDDYTHIRNNRIMFYEVQPTCTENTPPLPLDQIVTATVAYGPVISMWLPRILVSPCRLAIVKTGRGGQCGDSAAEKTNKS